MTAPAIAVSDLEKHYGDTCAVDGVSLTVNEVEGSRFGVNLIPATLTRTTWGSKRPGDEVNLEIDLLARYVARLIEQAR